MSDYLAAARVLFCLSFILLVASWSATVVKAGGTAPETINDFHEVLLGTMQRAQALGFTGRQREIGPAVKQAFDLPFVGRLVLARRWSALSLGQQERFLNAFERLVVGNYAAQFVGYEAHKFTLIADEATRRGRRVVRTELNSPSAEPVQFDYVLHETAGNWRVVNVVVNGVSDLSLKRTEYGAILKGQGFEALLTRLEAQISELH